MKKLTRKIYGMLSYVFFVLAVFSLFLNAVSLMTNFFIKDFTVALWEVVFLPVIIIFAIRHYHPIYPDCLA